MTRPCSALLFLTLLSAGLQYSRAQDRKYDMKSGVITFETVTTDGRVRTAGRVVVSFAQYGLQECKDTYDGGILKESVLSDGKTIYTVLHDQRIVFRCGPSNQGTEGRFDWDSFSVAALAERHIRRLAGTTLAGKTCTLFEQTGPTGSVKCAGWGHILLYREQTQQGRGFMMKAVAISEDAQVLPSKFAPPPGYTERAAHF